MHSFLTPRRVSVLAAVLPCLLILAAALVEPNFGYNRWDNFEFCTPIIWLAHSQWLQGSVPFWNPHQNLGEPFTLAMLAGVFYFPYTLCCLLVRLCGMRPAALPLVIVLVHTAFAAVGWERLLRFFEVRPAVRLLASASGALGGFATCFSSVWIFVSPVCAWLPWLLYATVRLLNDPWRFRPFLLLVLGLTALLYTGHAQFAIYAWLFAGIFALGYALLVVRHPRRLAAPAAAAFIAVLVGAVYWLPAHHHLQNTTASAPMLRSDFFFHSAVPSILRDTLLPVYEYFNGFMPGVPSLCAHAGSWVAAAILGGVIVMWQRRKQAPSDPLAKVFVVSLGCTLVFYLLAIGEKGPLLPLVYGLPLLSLFREPMKFLPFFLAAAVLAAGLALEMCWRQPGGAAWRKAAGFGVAALAAVLVAVDAHKYHEIVPALRTWSGKLSLAAGLVVMSMVPMRGRTARGIALAAGLLELAGFVALWHHQEPQRYHAPYGVIGPAQFGIDNNYRVMPLSEWFNKPRPAMEEYAVFHSATANGYFSASGHHTRNLLPRWFEHWLPVNQTGLLPVGADRLLTASNLLRSFNVRYYIVSKPDHLNLDSVAAKGLRRVRELSETLVYEDPQALPRVYFATEVYPYSDREAHDVLIKNRRAATAAVADWWHHSGPVATGEVLQVNWDNDVIRAEVRAPQGGFLVVSTTWYPGWSASVDGRPATVYAVNGPLLGLVVPAGGREVALRFRPAGWRRGLELTALGLLGLLAFGAASFRKRGSSDAPR